MNIENDDANIFRSVQLEERIEGTVEHHLL